MDAQFALIIGCTIRSYLFSFEFELTPFFRSTLLLCVLIYSSWYLKLAYDLIKAREQVHKEYE